MLPLKIPSDFIPIDDIAAIPRKTTNKLSWHFASRWWHCANDSLPPIATVHQAQVTLCRYWKTSADANPG